MIGRRQKGEVWSESTWVIVKKYILFWTKNKVSKIKRRIEASAKFFVLWLAESIFILKGPFIR